MEENPVRKGPYGGPGIDYQKDLNPEQYSAVMHGKGPCLVLAGAGTGKTRVVTYRVAHLIEKGVAAENILLLTFTNKAASEMMARAGRLVSGRIAGLSGGTFHHIANIILRRHRLTAGYKRDFTILDREDSKELFESCLSEMNLKKTALPGGAVLCEISGLARNTSRSTADAVLQRFPHFGHMIDDIEKVIQTYERKKLDLSLADFDDLLLKWKSLFQENEGIRRHYAEKFRYILVDEFQDTNKLQAGIIDLIVGGEKNLMVVGDDAQSIYSFRGADFENILGFPGQYPDARVFKLTTNYRSTPEILYLANRIIAANGRQFSKELSPVLKTGRSPGIAALKDAYKEAEFISSAVNEMYIQGRPLDTIAVLYRSHYQSMQVQMHFQKTGIPYEVRSGLKFFEQAHVKDILAYLRLLSNPLDEVSWKRLMKVIPGIGPATARKLCTALLSSKEPLESLAGLSRLVPKKSADGFRVLSETVQGLREGAYAGKPSGGVEFILRHGYEDYLYANYPNAEARTEDIVQLSKFALKYDSLDSLLDDLALDSGADGDTAGFRGRVVFSTVHQAKGLEWDVVFIIGMSDGKFPSAKSLRNDDEEEERRLFYVGATRARELLYLSYPVGAEDWGPGGYCKPSRFLSELPRDSFEEITLP